MRCTILWLVIITAFTWFGHRACGAQLFHEDFDTVPLGSPVEETTPGTNVWTAVPPPGWSINNSGVPGAGNAGNNNGVREWIGWTFTDPSWWSQVAGDQSRSQFNLGSGAIMVADPDEWDDQPHPTGTYNTFIRSPPIALNDAQGDTINVMFDSSWRPEDNQSANLTVSFDGAEPVEVLRWLSDPSSPNFQSDATNETVVVPLDQPAGAGSMVLTWGLFDAGNDWWWAVDNVSVFTGQAFPTLDVNTATGLITLRGGEILRDINGYEIRSQNGSLTPGTWAAGNLHARGIDAVEHPAGATPGAGNDGGETWEILAGTSHLLWEGFLLGSSLFDADRNESLGLGYDTGLDARDLVFQYATPSGEVFPGEVIYSSPPALTGDADCDGDVDFDDVPAFILGLTAPADYLDTYGVPPALKGDTDGDGDFDFDDIPGFVALLGAGMSTPVASAVVPEPPAGQLALCGWLLAVVAGACGADLRRCLRIAACRRSVAAGVLALLATGTPGPRAIAVDLFTEDFDALPLGPNVEEILPGAAVWTAIPPAGWTVDNSGVPGANNPPGNNGVTEWIGWTFADADWWAETAANQQRSQFFSASGAVMVADPDEWDDAPHPNGTYNTFVTTPSIDISGVTGNTIRLSFDSSWRPEGNQTGTISVAYDGAAPVEILRFASQPGPDFKADAPNESVELQLENPANADSMELTWGLFDAGNNWWWAIDNVRISAGDEALKMIVDRDNGRVTLTNQTAQPQTISSYSLSSRNGALNRQSWLSIAANYDTASPSTPDPGDGSVDPDDLWFEFGGDAVHDLSEGSVGFATLADGQSVDLGIGSWVRFFEEDLEFEYLDATGNVVEGLVSYVGNDGDPYPFGDLNFDGTFDIGDWQAFQGGLGSDLNGLSPAEAYQQSDLDRSGDHGLGDFVAFQQAFDAARGAGAFAAMVTALPEPSTSVLGLFGIAGFGLLARLTNGTAYRRRG